MSKARTLEVMPFGLLTHVHAELYEGPEIDVHFFGTDRKISISIMLDENLAPNSHQVKAYELFIADVPKAMKSAEAAVCKEYGSIHEEDAPNTEHVAKAVKLEGIHFPNYYDCPILGLLFSCDWDEEHGLGVRFEHGELTDVGPQDVAM